MPSSPVRGAPDRGWDPSAATPIPGLHLTPDVDVYSGSRSTLPPVRRRQISHLLRSPFRPVENRREMADRREYERFLQSDEQ